MSSGTTNGTMRHHIGPMPRRCLAFSKKIENHRASVWR